ncbi:MAG: hypothetical protein P8N31_07270 [Planctomycetota bacterium]|jgi:hypothetical protein|nr:hypothetical protein [Planctomycetota bacterium]
MKINTLAFLGMAGVLLGSTAGAQFSVSGPGSPIPASGTGGGGTWTGTLPPTPGTSVVAVPVQVTSIGTVEIMGLNHTYMGDLQFVLTDPAGVGHNLFVRPGKDYNGSNFGNSGDFLVGDYTIVESGGFNFPQDTNFVDLNPGSYNQSFTTGVTVWPAGQSNIQNTPLSQIQGSAGNWTLTCYDWAGGDQGSFSSWRLNGNGGTISGQAYCFGDGTGSPCPCLAFGGAGEGCLNTSGQGALLSGSGIPAISADTFILDVSGAPANKPGVIFQGTTQLANPFGDGLLCTTLSLQHGVMWTSATGTVTQSGFGASASIGATLNYQFLFRDPANGCGSGGFNYTNGWAATWQ